MTPLNTENRADFPQSTRTLSPDLFHKLNDAHATQNEHDGRRLKPFPFVLGSANGQDKVLFGSNSAKGFLLISYEERLGMLKVLATAISRLES